MDSYTFGHSHTGALVIDIAKYFCNLRIWRRLNSSCAGTLLFATWIPGQGCVITHTKIKVMIAQFIYSMCLDLIVLLLAAWKLPQRAHSKLGSILFRDGLIYFVFAYGFVSWWLKLPPDSPIMSSFLGNLLVVTFELLNLNPVMNVIFNVPSVLISTVRLTSFVKILFSSRVVKVAATRAVRNLATHIRPGVVELR